MEKTDSSQLELFGQGRGTNQPAKPLSRAFLDYLWSYEKTILLVICFIITGVISFSLGVEQGKRTHLTRIEVHKVPQAQVLPPVPLNNTPKIIVKPVAQESSALASSGYTIQVASYQTKKYAQKEAEAIRKKGFSSFVLSKGAFSVLCVGNFSTQESAKAVLAELKKQYKGCIIRRL